MVAKTARIQIKIQRRFQRTVLRTRRRKKLQKYKDHDTLAESWVRNLNTDYVWHFGVINYNSDSGVPYVRHFHTGYSIFHCDSMKHNVILHWITIKYAVSCVKLPHLQVCAISVLSSPILHSLSHHFHSPKPPRLLSPASSSHNGGPPCHSQFYSLESKNPNTFSKDCTFLQCCCQVSFHQK